jgi:hypothetical protein
MFYSKATGGFYTIEIHGAKTLTVLDPNWVRPTITVKDPAWFAEDHPENTQPATIEVPDSSAQHPTIEVINPDYKIPADAVEITVEQHAALLEGQSQGKQIAGDELGRPILVDAPVIEFSYAEKREREYPPITDYIDGVVKGDQSQIDKYISDCLAVKTKYPKN